MKWEGYLSSGLHWLCVSHSLNFRTLHWCAGSLLWGPQPPAHGYTGSQHAYQFSSVTQSCPTLCNPMDCSTPGFPVHHQLPEHAQTHVQQVGDTIQLKPFTSDWDENPHGWDSNQPKPILGLEPMWLEFETSQNPAWDLKQPKHTVPSFRT